MSASMHPVGQHVVAAAAQALGLSATCMQILYDKVRAREPRALEFEGIATPDQLVAFLHRQRLTSAAKQGFVYKRTDNSAPYRHCFKELDKYQAILNNPLCPAAVPCVLCAGASACPASPPEGAAAASPARVAIGPSGGAAAAATPVAAAPGEHAVSQHLVAAAVHHLMACAIKGQRGLLRRTIFRKVLQREPEAVSQLGVATPDQLVQFLVNARVIAKNTGEKVYLRQDSSSPYSVVVNTGVAISEVYDRVLAQQVPSKGGSHPRPAREGRPGPCAVCATRAQTAGRARPTELSAAAAAAALAAGQAQVESGAPAPAAPAARTARDGVFFHAAEQHLLAAAAQLLTDAGTDDGSAAMRLEDLHAQVGMAKLSRRSQV
jgi:hypothetical protein